MFNNDHYELGTCNVSGLSHCSREASGQPAQYMVESLLNRRGSVRSSDLPKATQLLTHRDGVQDCLASKQPKAFPKLSTELSTMTVTFMWGTGDSCTH